MQATELKVGVLVLGALILIGVVSWFFLSGLAVRGGYPIHVLFNNALGLQGGEAVRMSGVTVGEVSKVELAPAQQGARVTLRIKPQVRLYRNYRITITATMLISERQVEIDPASPPGSALPAGATVRGVDQPRLETLLSSASGLVAKLTETAASFNRLLGGKDFVEAVHATAANAKRITGSTADLMEANQRQINLMVSNALAVSAQFRQLAETLGPRLSRSTLPEDLEETARALRNASSQMAAVMEDLRQISGDPAIRAEIKQTIANLRDASEQFKLAAVDIKGTAENTREITGRFKGKIKKLTPIRSRPSVELDYLPEPGRAFLEADLDLILGSRMLRAGVTNLRDATRVNFQAGLYSPRRTLRAGLIQSSPGVGLDVLLFPGVTVTGELYNPSQLRANLLGEYRPEGSELGLIFGGRGLLRENFVGFGIKYQGK